MLLSCTWALAVGAVVFAEYRGRIDAYVVFHRWLAGHGVPDAVRNLDSLILFTIASLAGAFVATRFAAGTISHHLRLERGHGGWCRVALIALLPMIAGGAILAMTSKGRPIDLPSFMASAFRGVIRAPFMEELLFRGLLIAVNSLVLAWTGWRFWTNAFAAAILFAATHVDWTPGAVVSGWPTLLVTGLGGIWYAWLLSRWQTLWMPMVLHAGMNLGWMLAGATGGAGGGGLAINLLRAATIGIATWRTLRSTRNHLI